MSTTTCVTTAATTGIGDCYWYYAADNACSTGDSTSVSVWVSGELQWQSQILSGNSATITYTTTDTLEWHEYVLDSYGTFSKHINVPAPAPIIITPEQLAEQEARRLKLAAEAELKMQKRVIAEAKGEQLVVDIIGEEAFKQYKSKGYIDVPSLKEAGKSYRIRAERRIGIVKDGKELALSLCIHPQEWGFVRGDLLSTHILLCKFDEELLNKKAISHKMAA